MFETSRRRAVVYLAATDVLLAACAFQAAYWTRTAVPLQAFALEPAPRALLLLATVTVVVLAGSGTGTYSRLQQSEEGGALASTVVQLAVASLPLLAGLYLLNLAVPVSRLFLGLVFGYLGILQLALRAGVHRWRRPLRRALGSVSSIVVVGDGRKALEIARELERAERLGLRLLALVDCGSALAERAGPELGQGIRPLRALPAILDEEAVDQILFAASPEHLHRLEPIFALCDERGITTRVVADFFPHAHSRVHFDRFAGRPVLTFTVAPWDDLRLAVKRAGDVAIATLGLLALSLPLACVGLLVRLTSPGPALFRQERCGLNGRRFHCYKFRSMVDGAEERLADLEHLSEKDGPAFKMRNDPRMTPLGRILRRLSIDELPQLWNVLRGDMSLVGPRPALPREISRYEPWQYRRLRMRPGLTCLWAIRGRDSVDFETWMRTDLEYIDNWSLNLDLRILLSTLPIVLRGKGAS